MTWGKAIRQALRFLGLLQRRRPHADTVTITWDAPPAQPPAAPPLPRLRVDGRQFVREDGSPLAWRGLTAFALCHQIATGREAEAVALLDWAAAHGVTVVRVLTTAVNLFDLSPEAGRAALPRVLALAHARGLYVEVVALADTAQRAFDLEAHVAEVGRICGEATNAVVEISNEPIHPTQRAGLGEASTLLALRSLVPAGVLVSLGSTHGADDESDRFAAGDYLTVHFDRADGDGGWRAVRHVKEGRDLSARLVRPVVDDEPAKETDAAKWRVKGLLARVLPLPGTFHYQDGLQAIPPSGAILAAYTAWREGLNALPAGWDGAFFNAGWAGSPITGADWARVVRVYSSVSGDEAYSVLVGVTGDPRVEVADGWRVASQDGPLWRLTRC